MNDRRVPRLTVMDLRDTRELLDELVSRLQAAEPDRVVSRAEIVRALIRDAHAKVVAS